LVIIEIYCVFKSLVYYINLKSIKCRFFWHLWCENAVATTTTWKLQKSDFDATLPQVCKFRFLHQRYQKTRFLQWTLKKLADNSAIKYLEFIHAVSTVLIFGNLIFWIRIKSWNLGQANSSSKKDVEWWLLIHTFFIIHTVKDIIIWHSPVLGCVIFTV